MLVLPSQTRISQPQSSAGVDWTNSLTKGLLVAFNGAAPLINPVLNTTASGHTGTGITTTFRHGSQLKKFNGGTDTGKFNYNTPVESDKVTFLWAGYIDSSQNVNGGRIVSAYNGAGIGRFDISGNSTRTAFSCFRDTVVGQWYPSSGFNNVWGVFAVRYDGSNIANTPVFFLNGVAYSGTVVQTIAPSGNLVTPSNVHAIGGRADATTRQLNGQLSFAAAWNRLLTGKEIASLSANPWQIFQPDRRSIFLPATTVSDQSLTQSSLFSDADTFYAQLVTPGEIALSPSLYSDADTFYAPTVSQNAATQSLAQDATFLDTDAFYSPSVTPGSVSLTASLFTDADAFYSPTVSQVAPQTLTQTEVFENGNIFFEHRFASGAVGNPKFIWAKAKAKIGDVPFEGKQIIKAAKRQAKIDAVYDLCLLEYNDIQIKPPIVSDDEQVKYHAEIAYRRAFYAATQQRIAEYEQDEEDALLALML